ncbi:HK97 family phage prohead protease [Pseudarcicella hirudinis]|uniref:HK97 family phage prohead protease n=1 Tax=Pseudarcicella hirudinis TaxID=1079859 RepID=UPI0035E82EF9
MAKKKFVFNDETVTNSYNFKIKTSGIILNRFSANPVMLADHWNSLDSVIGKWDNISVEGVILSGEPLFDSEDAYAKTIEGKVERGFVIGCSMGISFSRDDMEQQPDGSWLLLRCELFEVSICAVPSNANSLRLYDASTKKLLTGDEVKLQLSFLDENKQNENTEIKMEKITLSVASLMTLGLNEQPKTAAELDTHIATLLQKFTTEQAEHQQTKQKLSSIAETQSKALINEAKLAGKITESEVAEWEKMAKDNYSLAFAALSKIPAKHNYQAV